MTVEHTRQRSSIAILLINLYRSAWSAMRTFGETVALFCDAVTALVVDAVRFRLQGKEIVQQAWYFAAVTILPAIMIAIPFGVIISLQVSAIIEQLGANSLAGAASGLAIIKQGAPLAAGVLLGGAGGAAIAADLGARTTREEIDAMKTLGINPINRLVAPRLLATALVAPLLTILIIGIGILASYAVAVLVVDVTPGSFWLSFGAFANPIDVWLAMLKSFIFALIVATIGCYRGLAARGGARGVADAVNATVVLSVASIMIVNLVMTQVIELYFPTKVG